MKTRVINQREELVNDKHIEDWVLTKGQVMPNFFGRIYENKFFAQDIKSIQKIISNQIAWKNKIAKLKQDCNIRHATCRFSFGNLKIPFSLQEQLIDFQANVFDDITVFMIKGQMTDFQNLLMYSSQKYPSKIICTWTDIAIPLVDMIGYHNHLENKVEVISYMKYEYKKFSTWINHYIIVKQFIEKHKMDALLTGCNKRCGEDGHKDIAATIVAIGKAGFRATNLDVKQTGRTGFAGFTDLFDSKTWEYKSHISGNLPLTIPVGFSQMKYRVARLSSNDLVNQAVRNINSNQINQRHNVASLFQKLAAQGL